MRKEMSIYYDLDAIHDCVVDWDEPFDVDLSLSVPEEQVMYVSDGTKNYAYVNGMLMPL